MYIWSRTYVLKFSRHEVNLFQKYLFSVDVTPSEEQQGKLADGTPGMKAGMAVDGNKGILKRKNSGSGPVEKSTNKVQFVTAGAMMKGKKECQSGRSGAKAVGMNMKQNNRKKMIIPKNQKKDLKGARKG